MQNNLEGVINSGVYASLDEHAGRCVFVGWHGMVRGEGVAFRDECSFLCKWTIKGKLFFVFYKVYKIALNLHAFMFFTGLAECTFLYKLLPELQKKNMRKEKARGFLK